MSRTGTEKEELTEARRQLTKCNSLTFPNFLERLKKAITSALEHRYESPQSKEIVNQKLHEIMKKSEDLKEKLATFKHKLSTIPQFLNHILDYLAEGFDPNDGTPESRSVMTSIESIKNKLNEMCQTLIELNKDLETVESFLKN